MNYMKQDYFVAGKAVDLIQAHLEGDGNLEDALPTFSSLAYEADE